MSATSGAPTLMKSHQWPRGMSSNTCWTSSWPWPSGAEGGDVAGWAALAVLTSRLGGDSGSDSNSKSARAAHELIDTKRSEIRRALRSEVHFRWGRWFDPSLLRDITICYIPSCCDRFSLPPTTRRRLIPRNAPLPCLRLTPHRLAIGVCQMGRPLHTKHRANAKSGTEEHIEFPLTRRRVLRGLECMAQPHSCLVLRQPQVSRTGNGEGCVLCQDLRTRDGGLAAMVTNTTFELLWSRACPRRLFGVLLLIA